MHVRPFALATFLLATLIACAGREETAPPRTVAIAEAPSHSTSRDTASESTALPIDAGTSNVADAGSAAQVFHLSHADRIPKLAGKHACFRSHAPGAVPPLTPHGAAACAKGARALELIETELVGIEDINDADDRAHAPPDPQRLLQTANLYSEWECAEYQECLFYRNVPWVPGVQGHVLGMLLRRDELCDELKKDFPNAAQCP